MNFGRLVFNRAVKLYSKSSAWIRFNNKFWVVNVANYCSRKPATKAVTAGIINRKEYCKENNFSSLTQIELEEFDATFSLIVNNLTKKNDVQDERIEDVFVRFKENLENNIPHGKKNRGLALVSAYKLLAKSEDLTEENIELANILGWCVEMKQAYFLIIDDIMDQSFTRRGMPCWFRNEHVGLMAINDAIMIENGIFYLLKKHFENLPCYLNIMETFHQIIRFTCFGQSLDMMSEYSRQPSKFDCFTEDKYTAIVTYKTAYYSFVLPVKSAFYLAGRINESFKNAEQLLLKIGHFFQVQDDYLDCYGDPVIIGKQGTDIEDGKCTWLIVTALKKASEEQIAILTENYGVHDKNAVKKVKEVYNELQLPMLYNHYEEKMFKELTRLIDDITNSTDLPSEIFHLFMKMLYKRKK